MDTIEYATFRYVTVEVEIIQLRVLQYHMFFLLDPIVTTFFQHAKQETSAPPPRLYPQHLGHSGRTTT